MTDQVTACGCSQRDTAANPQLNAATHPEIATLTRRDFLHLCAFTPSLGTLRSLEQVVGKPPAYIATADVAPTYLGQSLAEWFRRSILDDPVEPANCWDLIHFGEAAIAPSLRVLRDLASVNSDEGFHRSWVANFTIANVGPAAIPGLLDVLRNGSAPQRRGAIGQLEQLVVCSSFPTQLLRPILPAVLGAVADPELHDAALFAFLQIVHLSPELVTNQPREPNWDRVRQVLIVGDPQRRLIAANALLSVPATAPEAERVLHEALVSDDPVACRDAAQVLVDRQMFHPALVRTFERLILAGLTVQVPADDEMPGVRSAVIRLLAERLPEATPAVHHAFLGSMPWTCYDADRALLASELRHPDGQIRGAAIGVLRCQGADWPVEWLASQLVPLLNDEWAYIRLAAIEALSWLALPAELMVEPLCELLSDADPEIRLAVVKALTKNYRRASVDVHCLEELLADPDAAVRFAVTEALALPLRSADANACLDTLVAELLNGDCTAANKQDWLYCPASAVIERLRELLRCWWELTPDAIKAVLGMIERLRPEGQKLLPDLLPLLDAGGPKQQRDVLLVIASFDVEALPTLRNVARYGSPQLRKVACRKLDELESRQPIAPNQLLAAAGHGSVFRRVAAIKALANADTPSAATRRVLQGALGDRDIAVRQEAVSTLAERFGRDTDGPPEELIAVLEHDPCSTVRRRAANELGRLGRSADGVIVALLRQADPLLQSWLLQSLTAQGPGRTEILAAVRPFLTCQDAHLRGKAAGAMKKLVAWGSNVLTVGPT